MALTKKQLIEAMKDFDDDLEIVCSTPGGGLGSYSVEEVWKEATELWEGGRNFIVLEIR